MSVTVAGIPVVLLKVAAHTAIATIHEIALNIKGDETENADYLSSDVDLSKNIKIEELINKTYETDFVDKDTLLKTLKQYDAKNIAIEEYNISCMCDDFILHFFKENPDNKLSIYKLKVEYKKGENIEELIQDISDEYVMNTQEASYNKIKERLKEKQLEIENEEVLEDNTIVLTVNLE